MCRITVIFGTLNMLKDGSLLINIYVSNNWFSNGNIFQNGVDGLSRIDDAFLTKADFSFLFGLFDNVQISLACGINTYYRITNGISDFRCHQLQRQQETIHCNMNIYTNFSFMRFLVSIAVTKLPAKFEQNWKIWTRQNFDLFWHKRVHASHFWNIVSSILKEILHVKQLMMLRVFIIRVPSFILPKITVVWYLKPSLKLN